MRRSAPAGAWFVAGIAALGGLLRFATMGAQSFSRDEAVTALMLGGSFEDALDGVAKDQAMPPLYFLLAWLWAQGAGLGEVALRSLPALIGTAVIVVSYALGREIAGTVAGAIAATLVAVNPFLIWFSQDARPYALFCLLTSLTTLFWLRALAGGRSGWVGWAVIGSLSLLTHYFALFLLVPQGAALLWRPEGRQWAAVRFLAVPAFVLAALGPLLLSQRDGRIGWLVEAPRGQRLAEVGKHWVAGPFGSPVDVAVGAAAIMLAAAGAVAIVRSPRDGPSSPRTLAAAALAAAALPVALALFGTDYVLDRYLIASLVPLLVVSAAGFSLSRVGWVAGAATCLLMVGFTLTWMADPKLQREDWRAVARRVVRAGRGTPVVVGTFDQALITVYTDAHPLTARIATDDVFYVAPWRFGRPRPADPPAPARGFALVERVEMPTITLVRFHADHPIDVTPSAIEQHPLVPDDGGVALAVLTPRTQ